MEKLTPSRPRICPDPGRAIAAWSDQRQKHHAAPSENHDFGSTGQKLKGCDECGKDASGAAFPGSFLVGCEDVWKPPERGTLFGQTRELTNIPPNA